MAPSWIVRTKQSEKIQHDSDKLKTTIIGALRFILIKTNQNRKKAVTLIKMTTISINKFEQKTYTHLFWEIMWDWHFSIKIASSAHCVCGAQITDTTHFKAQKILKSCALFCYLDFKTHHFEFLFCINWSAEEQQHRATRRHAVVECSCACTLEYIVCFLTRWL